MNKAFTKLFEVGFFFSVDNQNFGNSYLTAFSEEKLLMSKDLNLGKHKRTVNNSISDTF